MVKNSISRGVYRIVNTVDGKYYIGSTNRSFEKRKESHFRDLRNNKHRSLHLQNAFNKYGESCFKFEVLHIIKQGDSRIIEQLYLDIACCRYNLTNTAFGGEKTKFSSIECCYILMDLYTTGNIELVTKRYGISKSAIWSLVGGDSYLRYGFYKLRELARESISNKGKTKKLNDTDIGRIKWLRKRVTTNELLLYFDVNRKAIATAVKKGIPEIPCPDILKHIHNTSGGKRRFKQINKTTGEERIWRTIETAVKETNVSRGAIRYALNGTGRKYSDRVLGDSRWEWID